MAAEIFPMARTDEYAKPVRASYPCFEVSGLDPVDARIIRILWGLDSIDVRVIKFMWALDLIDDRSLESCEFGS